MWDPRKNVSEKWAAPAARLEPGRQLAGTWQGSAKHPGPRAG